MTNKLFKTDSYLSEFEAEITAVNGDWITLEGTAFFPGGGGQMCDTGLMGGKKVVEAKEENGEIVHKVPGHEFKVGDRIWCSVDWDRRYDLMMGHTAEHLLFSSLQKQDPELNIVKIFISPEAKYNIVDRDISWEKIGEAVKFANKVIAENHSVRKYVMDRNDPNIENIRVKLNKIDDEELSVVEIEGVDVAACCGTHVYETGELVSIFVDKKTSAGKDGVEIHFKVGPAAIESMIDLSTSCLQVIDDLGSKPSDITRTVSNLKHECETYRRQIRESVSDSIRSLRPEKIGDKDVYKGVFPTSDRNVLTEFAESCKEKGAVAILVGKGDNLTIVMSSGDPNVDCKAILSETMKSLGGKGGGKPDFAQGGITDVALADEVIEFVTSKL